MAGPCGFRTSASKSETLERFFIVCRYLPFISLNMTGDFLDGEFLRMFNVTRPANDPLNSFGVPEGFQVLDLSTAAEYRFEDCSFIQNHVLHSKSITLESYSNDGYARFVWSLRFTADPTVLVISTHPSQARMGLCWLWVVTVIYSTTARTVYLEVTFSNTMKAGLSSRANSISHYRAANQA